ncbi:stage V sporulation protein AA [Cohnella silvisoli]|uniref:Stage V sporulation protein AA n=1 Tax=Cohnella silvisoli TaxID=2873699 RepID=A0ABV1KTC0_9BACL|nr:stage V sporulation protein AA [Cohnella silvisoli]MCD9021264.1 stage V sporulation protein AA [Cohnella silvisoli]
MKQFRETDNNVVYVRMRRRAVVVPRSVVTLGDVARLISDDISEERLKKLPLHRITDKDGNLLLIDMLQVVKAIREAEPGMIIETFGEPHVLLEISPAKKLKPRKLLLVLAWLLLFFGSGMAMMNFHADVNMPAVQRRITELITGRSGPHPWLFQIPYSIGIGMGMLLFFNRIFSKRLNDEPNPLEVEMFMYQENVNHYVITEEYRKKHEDQVGGDSG